ncbi:hypothetical protein L1887_01331 [Cichorium endivia]|nr:hypothetical protein L1887_01331 [Cichorium endivia]
MLPPPLHVKKKEKPIHLPEAPQQFFSITGSFHMVAGWKNLKKAFGVLVEILLLLVTNEHPTLSATSCATLILIGYKLLAMCKNASYLI